MKRILHMFAAVLVLAAVMLLPATGALAAEGGAGASPAPADYITVDGGTVTLCSDSMAAEGISSLQLTLTGADGFTFSEALADRMTHVSHTVDGVTIYIAGAAPLMAEGTPLVLGTVTPADGTVTLEENSLKYVYGSRAIIRNVVDKDEEAEPQADDMTGMTPEEVKASLEALAESAEAAAADQYSAESWSTLQTAIERVRGVLARYEASGEVTAEELIQAYDELEAAYEDRLPAGGQPGNGGFADNNAGGAIGDGYDDGTGSGDPEPTATPEPTPIPTATPEPTAEPTATAAPTETPLATSEPMTRSADTAAPAVTTQPAAAGPSAPATGDETVLLPWALTLILCGSLLAVVLVCGKHHL